MSLTRHLYSLTEVLSALQISLRIGNGRAYFWMWELVVSMEYNAAKNAAIEAWLLWGGGHDPWIQTLALPTTAESAYALVTRVQQAIQKAREGNMTAYRFLRELSTNETAPPLQVPMDMLIHIHYTPKEIQQKMKTSHEDLEYIQKYWTHFYCAIKTQSRRNAIWHLKNALNVLSPETIWFFFHTIATEIGETRLVSPSSVTVLSIELLRRHAGIELESQIFYLATAILVLCNPATTLVSVQKPRITVLALCEWKEWMSRLGHRSARIHAIPYDALHTGTNRGSLSVAYTTIEELRDPIPGLLKGCEFWRQVLTGYGAYYDAEEDRLAFPDDDALEHFYTEYFPDDIPDEWSLEEQHKSHGVGCLETASLPPSHQVFAEWGSKKVDDDLVTMMGQTHV